MILHKFTMLHGVHVGHTSTLYMHVYMYMYVRDCIVLVDQCLGPGFVLNIEFTWHNASHDTTLDHMMSHDLCAGRSIYSVALWTTASRYGTWSRVRWSVPYQLMKILCALSPSMEAGCTVDL